MRCNSQKILEKKDDTQAKETVTTEDINFKAMQKPESIDLDNSCQWGIDNFKGFNFTSIEQVATLKNIQNDAKVCGVLWYTDLLGGDLKEEDCQDYEKAVERVLEFNWSSRWAFQWRRHQKKLFQKAAYTEESKYYHWCKLPAQSERRQEHHRIPKERPYNLFVFGKYTG